MIKLVYKLYKIFLYLSINKILKQNCFKKIEKTYQEPPYWVLKQNGFVLVKVWMYNNNVRITLSKDRAYCEISSEIEYSNDTPTKIMESINNLAKNELTSSRYNFSKDKIESFEILSKINCLEIYKMMFVENDSYRTNKSTRTNPYFNTDVIKQMVYYYKNLLKN
jgi:hypothetical protein